MSGFYSAVTSTFLETPTHEIVDRLASEIIAAGFVGSFQAQRQTWISQVEIMKEALGGAATELPDAGKWGVIFEYPLLRLQKRLDVVVLARECILVIEFKRGADTFTPYVRQAEDYALNLRDFHTGSHQRTIVPVVCSTGAHGLKTAPAYDSGVTQCCWADPSSLQTLLVAAASSIEGSQIDLDTWERSEYRPVPTIIKAAELLFSGHEVSEIANASSDPKNLSQTTTALVELITRARNERENLVVFVTGVPGSGKTLVGLNAVHDPRFKLDEHASAFLSGNTPLLSVLTEALARDRASREGDKIDEARRVIRGQIQALNGYLGQYLLKSPDKPPSEHVIVFDEAQRAWDANFGAAKFQLAKSEPALFLEIMARHDDWAVIVALVGGGQEINKGERGLREWGDALQQFNLSNPKPWKVIAAPDVSFGGDATAWQTLFPDLSPPWVSLREELHLKQNIRSYRTSATAAWVNAFIDHGPDATSADQELPIYLTRRLSDAKRWLHEQARGHRRCGLLASSGGRRLRAEGLPSTLSAADLDEVAHWYLRPHGDVRSSNVLEVPVSEYTCQGLEIDYAGLCWDLDLYWSFKEARWKQQRFAGSLWQRVSSPDMRQWILNKYRVLLTRARLGTVIFVPTGDKHDHTRPPRRYDQVANALLAAGAKLLPTDQEHLS